MPAAIPNTLARRPDIVHLHKPYDFPLGPFAHAVGAKVLYHGHGEDFYPFDQPLSRTADAMLSCSGYNAETVAARYHTQPEVVFNGFDAELFRPVSLTADERVQWLQPGERGIVQAVRLQPWKGIQYAIHALRHLVPRHRVRLLIAGDGTYRAALEQLVAELNLQAHVTFLGSVPNKLIPRLYAAADVVLGTSFASETFGMALCEALACERPVVASDWAGFREVIVDDVSGLVVPAQDPPALAAAIERLLNDQALARRLAQGGRQRVHQLFTWEAVTNRIESAYHRLLTSG